MDKISANDYEILKFVNENPNVKQPTIIDNFQTSIKGIPYRLEQLSKGPLSDAYLDCRYYSSVASYTITEKGSSALQDYYLSVHNHKKELWLKNAWLPIMAALLTTIIIDVLKWLFPLIIQWLSSFPG